MEEENKCTTSLQCPLCQQADSALHILSGCRHTIILGMITERHNVACRLILKSISKGSLAGCLVHLVASSTACLAQQILKFLSMQIPGHYPDGFLMLVDLLQIDSPLVALLPFWSHLQTEKLKSPTTPHLHQVPHPRQPSGDVLRAYKLNVSKNEIHLVEFKHHEDTRPA